MFSKFYKIRLKKQFTPILIRSQVCVWPLPLKLGVSVCLDKPVESLNLLLIVKGSGFKHRASGRKRKDENRVRVFH